MSRYRDLMELGVLALNHESGPDALALSMANDRPIAYSATASTGLVFSEPPAPQAEPEPPVFEAAREIGVRRAALPPAGRLLAPSPGSPEVGFTSSWHRQGLAEPWWATEARRESERLAGEAENQRLVNRMVSAAYAKDWNPRSADPDAGAVYAREWGPALDAFLARDPRQDRRPGR